MEGVTAFSNSEAEASVLAALMQDADLAREIPSISEADFADFENQNIFNALQQMAIQKGD